MLEFFWTPWNRNPFYITSSVSFHFGWSSSDWTEAAFSHCHLCQASGRQEATQGKARAVVGTLWIQLCLMLRSDKRMVRLAHPKPSLAMIKRQRVRRCEQWPSGHWSRTRLQLPGMGIFRADRIRRTTKWLKTRRLSAGEIGQHRNLTEPMRMAAGRDLNTKSAGSFFESYTPGPRTTRK